MHFVIGSERYLNIPHFPASESDKQFNIFAYKFCCFDLLKFAIWSMYVYILNISS